MWGPVVTENMSTDRTYLQSICCVTARWSEEKGGFDVQHFSVGRCGEGKVLEGFKIFLSSQCVRLYGQPYTKNITP